MVKFSRIIARAHDLTTDNIVDGVKATGRVAKRGINAVKVEHALIEQESAAKRALKEKALAAYEAELAKNQPSSNVTSAKA